MTTTTDIIIIGGGIAGTSAAAALAGTASVTVLEQETHPGYHSTGRSAATWAPFYGPSVIQQLTVLSKQTLCAPSSELGGNSFTTPVGEMMLSTASDGAEIEELKSLGMHSISLEDALQMVPLLRREAVSSVLYTDAMLRIDVDALHQAYIKALKSAGGEVHCSEKVESLDYIDQNWTVTTRDHRYTAPVIINAAGAWADEIARMAGARPTGLQPKRRSAALVPYAENANMEKWPMVFGAGEVFYCTPFGNGMMISPADETHVEPHDAWPDEMDLATGIDQFQSMINYDVPRISHSWAGLRTFAPDGSPVVGFDPELPGFFWLAGQGGYGIQTSPAMASLVAMLIRGSHAGPASGNLSGNLIVEQEHNTLASLAGHLCPSRFSSSQA